MAEIWKPIPGYEGLYEISNKCVIRSLPRDIKRDKFGVLRIPGATLKKNKSNQVRLYKDKKGSSLSVKKIFMIVFGESKMPKTKYEALTFDGEKPVLTTQRKIVAHAKKRQKTKKCKYTGVSLRTKGKKYQAGITINKKVIHLGCFDHQKDAAIMYRKAEKYLYLYTGCSAKFREMLRETFIENTAT